MADQAYSIRVASRRTGLTPHVIRVWERRYGAVSPDRTPTNRRLYSDADIERLRLLRQATLAGHSIGRIAQLPNEQLASLIAADEAARSEVGPSPRVSPAAPEVQTFLSECLGAVRGYDSQKLEGSLNSAVLVLSRKVLLEELIVKLVVRIGELWREGDLRVAQEHLATAVLRTFLGRIEQPQSYTAPGLVTATLAGQNHELGALMVGAAAAADGWRVTYLGPNLPAEEIAAAAKQVQARVVALSLIFPPNDPHAADELKELHRYLPDDVVLLVGGRAAGSYDKVLREIGASRLPDMESLRAHLESIRG